jgi:O-antigen/teichoic acid export membrane protein
VAEASSPYDDPRFATGVKTEGLWTHSLQSGAVTVTGQACGFVLRIAATLVLARILTPADYGVVAIASAAVLLVALFKDLGLAQAAVQGATLSQEQVSTLFWINTANGLALALVSALTAPLLGWLFGDARVTQAALGLAPIHFFAGLSAQHQAVLRRQLRLKTLAALEILAVLVGVLAAIAAARAGAGFWALVLMQCAIAFVVAAAALALSPLRPGRPVRGAGLRPLLAFGGQVTAFGVSSYFARNADSLLLGRRYGAHPLGLYDKAYQLMLAPLQLVTMALSSVALPVLSRLQADAARFREYYRLFLGMSVGLTMPLTALLFVTADRVIPLLLGPQWIASVPLFRALAPAAFGDALTITAGWIFMSLGRTARQVGFSLASSLVTVLALVIALPYGPLGVALAFSACRLLLPLPTFLFTCRETPIAWIEPLALAALPAASALAAAVLLWQLEERLFSATGVRGLLAGALLYGLSYLLLVGAGWLLLRPPATRLRRR